MRANTHLQVCPSIYACMYIYSHTGIYTYIYKHMGRDERGENMHVCVFVCNKNCFALIFSYLLSVLILFVSMGFSFERQKERI